MSAPIYRLWLTKAWRQLEEDYFSQRFVPQDEYDVQSHLYSQLFRLRNEFVSSASIIVTTEWGNTDIAIIDKGRYELDYWGSRAVVHRSSDVEPTQRPFLLVEVKETHLTEAKGHTQKDFDEFLENRKEIKEKIETLERLGREWKLDKQSLVYALFFRGAVTGISETTKDKCKASSEKYFHDVDFIHGPQRQR